MTAAPLFDRSITDAEPVPFEAALAGLREVADGAVVVFDLEYTSWPGSVASNWSGPNEYRELIQIGAVRTSGFPVFSEQAALSCLVRPTLNPVLSEHVQALTGITQAAVDAAGETCAAAMARLFEFAGGATSLLSNGNDGAVLAENARINGLPDPRQGRRFFNVRPLLGAALGRPNRSFSSADLGALVGFAGSGAAHDALSDARAVAAALAWAARKRL